MVVKKDVEYFRSFYESHWGHVDSISHICGVASHEKFYGQMTAWHAFVDSILPDFIPFAQIQGFFQTIIDNIYAREAQLHYDKGVDQGRAFVGEITKYTDWAKAEIQTKATEITNWANGELGKVNDFINKNINPALTDAQTKINGFKTDIQGMFTQVTTIKTQAESALNNAKSALANADSAVNYINTTIIPDLNSKAQNISNLLNDASAKSKLITDILSQLSSIKNRIANLELNKGVQPPSTEQPNSLRTQLENIFS